MRNFLIYGGLGKQIDRSCLLRAFSLQLSSQMALVCINTIANKLIFDLRFTNEIYETKRNREAIGEQAKSGNPFLDRRS